ncbi:MAG: GNAT family N-acetyltransferase [Anaerolineae bacterium]|nr:GNAT family N-acetyltransferase [Anaerolineae bacterium]
MTIEPISCDQLAQISKLFKIAFRDDPGLQQICNHPKNGYESRLGVWFGAILKMQMANQQPVLGIKVNDMYVACAMLTTPHAKLQATTLLRWAWLVITQAGFRCFWQTMRHIMKIAPYQPKTGHYRLEFIAVHPDYQGKGYGRMLLDKIHQMSQADAHSQGVWLETTLPDNIGLYVHVGYVIEKRLMMTDDVEAVILFRRDT